MHTFTVCIYDSNEGAKLEVAADRSEVSVFSDRLGLEGGISTAAVLYKDGEEKYSLRKFMSSKERHTVFEAELLCLLLGAEMIKDKRQAQSLTIGVDSQAPLHATGYTRAIPGEIPGGGLP